MDLVLRNVLLVDGDAVVIADIGMCMANSYLLLRCDWSKPRLPQIS